MVVKKNMELNNIELELYRYIESDTVKDIFKDLVLFSKSLDKFKCCARNKGKKNFSYYDKQNYSPDKQKNDKPFSLIVNKNDLLFYIRKPAFKKNKELDKYIDRKIINFIERQDGEYAGKINNFEQLEEVKNILSEA